MTVSVTIFYATFWQSFRSIMTNVLDCDLEVKQVRTLVALQCSLSNYYTWKKHKLSYPSSYGLNSITTLLLQEKLWHKITHNGWYAIKQRSQTYFIIYFFRWSINNNYYYYSFLLVFFFLFGLLNSNCFLSQIAWIAISMTIGNSLHRIQ